MSCLFKVILFPTIFSLFDGQVILPKPKLETVPRLVLFKDKSKTRTLSYIEAVCSSDDPMIIEEHASTVEPEDALAIAL